MSLNKILTLSLAVALFSSSSVFATMESMRGANAVHHNTQLSQSLNLTIDEKGNIISFHNNGINPSDAGILLAQDAGALSQEYTCITGVTPEGTTTCYMLPTPVATSYVIEGVSKSLVNSGARNIDISTKTTGKS